MMYKNSQQSGFSLVETLVSITILLIVIVGPMSISSNAAKSSSFSNEQVTAFFLAQEGLEIAQKARDDLVIKFFTSPQLEANPWDEFSDDSGSARFRRCYMSSGCGLELNTDTKGTLKPVEACGPSGDCRLYLDSSNERAHYTYESAGNIETEFTRIIYFENVSLGEMKVTSKVYWRTGSRKVVQEVEVVTYLFNVYEGYGT